MTTIEEKKGINKAVMERYGALSEEGNTLRKLYATERALEYCIKALKSSQFITDGVIKDVMETVDDLRYGLLLCERLRLYMIALRESALLTVSAPDCILRAREKKGVELHGLIFFLQISVSTSHIGIFANFHIAPSLNLPVPIRYSETRKIFFGKISILSNKRILDSKLRLE